MGQTIENLCLIVCLQSNYLFLVYTITSVHKSSCTNKLPTNSMFMNEQILQIKLFNTRYRIAYWFAQNIKDKNRFAQTIGGRTAA